MKRFTYLLCFLVMLLTLITANSLAMSSSFGEAKVMRNNVRYVCKHCKNTQEFIVRFRMKKCSASPNGQHEYVLLNSNLPNGEDEKPLQINF